MIWEKKEEKIRANDLLKSIEILDEVDWGKELEIPDFQLQISERVDAIPISKTVGSQQKEIFGLADCIPGMATMTSNQGFVRALTQSGVHLHIIMHESRALLTNKYQI